MKAEQGDLLRINGIFHQVLVVSNNYFNESDMVVVCPVVNNAMEGPLHIKLRIDEADAYVLCEQLKLIDLKTRRFSKTGAVLHYDVLNTTDAIIGIFDYQVL